MIGCLGHSCLSFIVDVVEVLLVVEYEFSVDSVSSDLSWDSLKVLVAGELGFDSGTGSVGIVEVCVLLIAVRCARMWSQVVVFGTGRVHTCFACSLGLVRCLQHSAGVGFDGLEMFEIGYFVVLGESLGKVETVCCCFLALGLVNEHGPEMTVTGCSSGEWLLCCGSGSWNECAVMVVVVECSGHRCWLFLMVGFTLQFYDVASRYGGMWGDCALDVLSGVCRAGKKNFLTLL